MSNDIYTLKLHEKLTLKVGEHEWITVLRVPGGWIYSLTLDEKLVFVPYYSSSEFGLKTPSRNERFKHETR